MASEQNILQQGNLQKWKTDSDKKKSSWQEMYFVLHGASNRNAARLDWYDSQDQYLKNPGTRKALFIEEIRSCGQIPITSETKSVYGPGAKYLLIIHTYRTNISDYILKFDSEQLLKEWLDQLLRLSKDVFAASNTMRKTIIEKPPDPDNIYNPGIVAAESFDVQIDDTAAAILCELQGSYRLILSQQHITLVDPDSSNPVITWMYKHIRRFGYSERSLTLEGGNKCGTGKGLFIFKTGQGNEVMDAINKRIAACRSQEQTPEQNDYSYISFNEVKGKPAGQSGAKSEEKQVSSMYGNAGLVKPKPNTKKPPAAQKPPPSGAPIDYEIAAGPTVGSHPQPKMSEVLSQMATEKSSSYAPEEDVYGYNHLDIHKTAQRTNTNKCEEENPYGEQLVQKLQNSK